ncbi:hypothetical protein HYT56_01970 [Candidatus Woesearchaeota archaeon]|nr:hypothetical protein [Candidatus Woesearchaeota archaeon]
MIFEYDNTLEKAGIKTGYVFSYFLFTTILFFIILSLDKPLGYFHVMLLSLGIVFVGFLIKRFLK